MIRRLSIFCIVFTLLLTSCSDTPAAPKLVHIRLPMGYIPNIQFAPFYLAEERGYFHQAGIEIEFDYSFETDGVALVGANELQFALASGEQVLLAQAQGLPVVYVMAWWQDFPIAIVAPADSGIHSPEDLKGKKIGIPFLGGASYIGYRALMNAAGVAYDAASLDSIGFNQVEALLAGQEDAVVVYAANEPVQLQASGMALNEIRVKDYANLASNGLITNEDTIAHHPELIRRLIQAILRGVSEVIEDPESAYEISLKYVEGLSEADATVQRKILAESIEFWKAKRLGYIDPGAWNNMYQVLLDIGLLEGPLKVDQAFTNQYIP